MARIKRRQIEQGQSIEKPPSLLYQSLSTMREFNLVPADWSKLSRIDKKVLYYFRAMEGHYFDIEKEKGRQKAKLDETRSQLPHISKNKRRLR